MTDELWNSYVIGGLISVILAVAWGGFLVPEIDYLVYLSTGTYFWGYSMALDVFMYDWIPVILGVIGFAAIIYGLYKASK